MLEKYEQFSQEGYIRIKLHFFYIACQNGTLMKTYTVHNFL